MSDSNLLHIIKKGNRDGRQSPQNAGTVRPYVTLAEARQAAFEYRKIARAGSDPLALKRRQDVLTFADPVRRKRPGR